MPREFVMNVLVTGSRGVIGRALVPYLISNGYGVVRLVRAKMRSAADEAAWDPSTGTIDRAALEGAVAVVHLSGESIFGRWTARKKARIRDSRVQPTRLLSESLAQLDCPPRALICASAVGFYGDRGNAALTEESSSGNSFLAEVCREWEAATQVAANAGIRVVNLRTGIVLTPDGGALATMLLPFRLGLGGRIGSGKQFMSWITRDDLLAVILHALRTETLRGPVNAVAPSPVTNAEFTRALGRILVRPTLFPVPAFAARLVLGQMGEELLLASARVEPARLRATGFRFRFPELEGALRYLLGGGI
jgi:hypothetical protein